MMRFSAIRIASLVVVAGLILAGCAASQSSPTNSNAQIPVSAATSAPTAAPAQASNASASSTNGTIRCVLIAGANEASYSVREQLARLSFPTDAVGKTNQVSGEIDIQKDGTIDQSKSKFVVDLTSLQTDSNMRDNFVRRNVLETNQYPQAVFVPTQVTGLATPLPPTGNVNFKIAGDMTIHGVTKPVTWDVTGTAKNGSATGTATTSFKFEDFNISQPRVPVVLSLVDNINLTVTLSLQQAQ